MRGILLPFSLRLFSGGDPSPSCEYATLGMSRSERGVQVPTEESFEDCDDGGVGS